jgi:uncharacterized protein
MRCPNCERETTFEGNPFRPFCSERCKLIDLDNWLSGRYRISTPLHRSEEAVTPEEGTDREFREGDSSGSE